MEGVWTDTVPSTRTARALSSGVAAGGVPPGEPGPRTVAEVLVELVRDPGRYLIARWNWKSALMSSLLRATIFFFTNLVAGWHAALGAMCAELILRSATSGFYGALTGIRLCATFVGGDHHCNGAAPLRLALAGISGALSCATRPEIGIEHRQLPWRSRPSRRLLIFTPCSAGRSHRRPRQPAFAGRSEPSSGSDWGISYRWSGRILASRILRRKRGL